MDTGTRWLIVILILAALVVVDVSWYRSHYLNQTGQFFSRLLSGWR